jgi:uncharacterized membrane protein
MTEHVVTKLGDPDDTAEHVLDCGDPEQVAVERARVTRMDEVRRALAEAAGVTVEELREALA